MTQEQALTLRAERLVNFYGDQITVALVGEDEPYVPLRTVAEYLGLELSSQSRRVQRDRLLARSIRTGLRRPDMAHLVELQDRDLAGRTVRRVR